MLEDAAVDLLLRRGGEGVVPLQSGGAVLRAEVVVRREVRLHVGGGGAAARRLLGGGSGGDGLDAGEEREEEGDGQEEVREAVHGGRRGLRDKVDVRCTKRKTKNEEEEEEEEETRGREEELGHPARGIDSDGESALKYVRLGRSDFRCGDDAKGYNTQVPGGEPREQYGM